MEVESEVRQSIFAKLDIATLLTSPLILWLESRFPACHLPQILGDIEPTASQSSQTAVVVVLFSALWPGKDCLERPRQDSALTEYRQKGHH